MASLDLFVFVDALGWKLAEDHDFLRDLLPHRAPCETLFGYSSACDPSILTGVLPQAHGHFNCFVRAPEGGSPFGAFRWLGCLPHAPFAHHRFRHRLSRLLARTLGYTGYFQLGNVPFSALPYLDYTEKKDIYAVDGILGGQKTIFDVWKGGGRPWLRSRWQVGDEANWQAFETAVRASKIELGYLFTCALDALLHRHGPHSVAARVGLAAFSERLRRLYTIAVETAHYEKVRFHVFSDHGMAEVQKTSDLMKRWEALEFQYGRDYVAVWDSTMARFWFSEKDPTVKEKALAWLQAQPEGRIVADDELTAWGCGFEDHRYGEAFYLLPPGSLFVPSFANRGFVNGMHGYDPNHEDSTACWLSNTDDFGKPSCLTDIFNIMKKAAH